ncbi:MAG: hypothetical protein QNJ42_08820 [Crocosphaera sp.]|nr:hypothetical protein [Crocosphaera sp.]
MKSHPINDQGFTNAYRTLYQLLCTFRNKGIGGKIVVLVEKLKDGKLSFCITSSENHTFTETFAVNTDNSDNSETL